MKMHLMTFDEAREAFIREYPMETDAIEEGYTFGIGKDFLPWGENVEVNIKTLDNSNNLSTYKLYNFFVPTCMFKIVDENPADKNLDKELFVIDILRYGTVLSDDELLDETKACVRIKVMSYEQNIYYIKMVNSEIVGFKKVGVVG